MAKRFIDTDLFRKPFMRGLDAPYKALWVYLLCECDHAGVWVVELDVAQIRLGMRLDPDKVLDRMGGAVVPIDGGNKWFLPDFLEFQYGTLNPANRVHASVMDRLSKCGIDPNARAEIKPLTSPLQGAKDKDKDTQRRVERAREDPSFQLWWTTYAKGSRKLSAAEWIKLSNEDRQACIAATPAYLVSKPDKVYRKDGERYLKHRTWEDPIVEPTPVTASNGKMTSDQAREAIAALRAQHGIKPGGAIESHLIPTHIREALR